MCIWQIASRSVLLSPGIDLVFESKKRVIKSGIESPLALFPWEVSRISRFGAMASFVPFPASKPLAATFKLLRNWFLILLFFSSSLLFSSVEGECMFPSEWSGKWFQGGRGDLGLVVVNKTHFSNGQCVEEGKASRYFVYLKHERCYKCVVIHMKHRNVIHYKESYCDPSTRDMTSACDTITGDNRLFWMFRWNADIVSCPFKGPLTFVYSKGWDKECSNPVSQVDSCADDMRLLFRQQACPDVPNSQSKEEELVCLGTWKDGSDHYFAGKINHSHAFTDEDRYRCFMYAKTLHSQHRYDETNGNEKDRPLFYLTMSNDAACQSLNSVTDGAKIMKLRKANHNNKKCKFPSWLSQHTHWHTLDFSQSYFLYHRNASLKISNGTAPPKNLEVRGHTDLRLICHKYESYHDTRDNRKEHRSGHQKEHHNHADHVTIIVHFTVGCRSGYRCMRVYRRDVNVVQVQFGNDALTSKEACNKFYWEPKKAEYITLVAQGENKGSCGPYGKYHVPESQNLTSVCNPLDGKSSSFSHLTVGCSQHDTLELHEKCPTQEVDSYQCHGEWKSDGVTYVVASPVSRPSGAPKRVCFAYSQAGDSGTGRFPAQLVFTARHDTCISRRDDAHLTLNATLIGQCTEASEMASRAGNLKTTLGITSPVGGLVLYIFVFFKFNSLVQWLRDFGFNCSL